MFRYASANPLRYSDPLGLFSFDTQSCCEVNGPDPRAAAKSACALFRRPNCRKLLAGQSWMGAKDRGSNSVGNASGCYSRLCDPFNDEPFIKCVKGSNACGETPPGGGILLSVPGSNTCGRRFGEPQDYGITIFHEIGHNCGLTTHTDAWKATMLVCTGVTD